MVIIEKQWDNKIKKWDLEFIWGWNKIEIRLNFEYLIIV